MSKGRNSVRWKPFISLHFTAFCRGGSVKGEYFGIEIVFLIAREIYYDLSDFKIFDLRKTSLCFKFKLTLDPNTMYLHNDGQKMENSHIRDSIVDCFKRLDTVMAVESQRNRGSGKHTLKELKQQIPELNLKAILLIKSVFPESYDVKVLQINSNIEDNVLVSIYNDDLQDSNNVLTNSPIMKLSGRLKVFSHALDQKMSGLKDDQDIQHLITFKPELQSTDKQIRIKPIQKKAIVKNDSTRFQFHERDANIASNKESILQRIRNKEKNNSSAERELHRRKQRFINSKLEMIYDAFYVECPPGSGVKSLTMTQVARILNDASRNPMALEDIIEGVKKLDKAIDGIRYVTIDKVRLVRITNLNRLADLPKLKIARKFT